jgi:predicted nucleic acid-binding protein
VRYSHWLAGGTVAVIVAGLGICLELGKRIGRDARLAFLADLAAERFRIACLEPADYQVIADLERRYASLDVGLADLSTVIAAGKAGIRRVLTFDERHFRVLRPLNGGTFTLLPAEV